MNHYLPATTAGNAVDATTVRTFLQQAVDHYPRLVAFSLTLVLPHRDTMTDYRAVILRFHTDVWQRTGEYSWERQQERKNSPPTILRWIWEAVCAPECKMVLMMNLDTLAVGSSAQRVEHAMKVMSELLREAWLTVCGAEHIGVENLTPLVISRTGCGSFTGPFNQLKARAQEMTTPVTLARTGVICT
ncbi:YagK/YfjJ domain-containing protein [Citrobacter koseri]|uniref:YagK/YfjJ domain-containing protein n=1 Tax=Citrobacter koseri TaxID=545 RepID=UPI000E08A3D6|nr:inovirus-type Gp2 protein [Citrobacter koseri]STA81128.1 Uncharacterised protein [Citrobacter koseri]STT20241.1 Uncharacterised protein [Citrobacter koseri]